MMENRELWDIMVGLLYINGLRMIDHCLGAENIESEGIVNSNYFYIFKAIIY